MSAQYDFFIIAGDRDVSSKEPFKQVDLEKWTEEKNAKVYYINPKKNCHFVFWRMLREK